MEIVMETQDIFGALLSVFLVIAVGWMLINHYLQERAENKINKFHGQYQLMVGEIGLEFVVFTRSGDPTPGIDTIVFFSGPTVNAELTPLQALHFLDTLHKGSPDIGYLEERSKWPRSEIPQ
jgi:hypothetical protein